jgi:molybdopterin molybdotransferase
LPGQIRDSNSLALAALCEEAGAEVALMEHLPDDRDATLAGFERAARDCDVIVSSGGVSVGKYDYVKDVVQQLGGIDLWRVAMQPGKPVVLGRVKDKPFLGLPGNPVSIHIGFEQFVRPALRKMRGLRALLRPTVRARLEKPLRKSPGRLQFVRVRLAYRDEIFWALPAKGQGSHMQSSLVGCHGVAHFAADATHLEAGDEVEVEVWRLPEGQ